jgi:MutL protein
MSTAASILSVEVGSTVTKAIAFSDAKILGRATALTTPDDISVCVRAALAELKKRCGVEAQDAGAFYATSSAAGGLRMTVHGLTRDLTARAAEEASLGAGANVKLITAGGLGARDIRTLEAVAPNLVMLAGGVEHGEEDVVLENARLLAAAGFDAPVVYAGNAVLRDEVRETFSAAGRELHIVENVYPRFDELNVAPVRAIIQKLFAERLTLAPGMDELRRLAGGRILPVPGACLLAAETLAEEVGDLVVVDVGGATTDVHSVIDAPGAGNVDAQVRSRRTVEGDLGLFISADSVWAAMGREGVPAPLAAVPGTDEEQTLSRELACKAVELALLRHAGRTIPGAVLADGTVQVRGRDLRSAKLVVGTGGGLSRLPGGLEGLEAALGTRRRNALLPGKDVAVRCDRDYILSACGAFAADHPQLARALMLSSIGGWQAGV